MVEAYRNLKRYLGLPQCTIRVPMLWFRGPIQPHAGSHPAHVWLVDVYPTLGEAIGAPVPPGVQGHSL